MPVATMTSKGQITVPKEVRDDLHLTAGSKVLFVKLRSGHYRIVPRTGKVQDLGGMLYDPNEPPMTIHEIEDAIAEGGAASGMTGIE
ncbi:AbrB/MazE/SpoVT family DNA-binding domain-containing protein [Agromyces bauzanensis]